MAAVERPECLDFLQFQDAIKKMRELDDKIIYTLNALLPTESFKDQTNSTSTCKELFDQLQESFNRRSETIQGCINFTKDKVLDLKKQQEISNDINIHKSLKKEQSKLRLLNTELGVEEVVRQKTSKILYERCRSHYVPHNFSL